MSYILEALRKADAERERERTRGSVPNLHAQLTPLTASRVDDEAARMPIGWWVGIGSAVLLLGLLVWWWLATVGGAGLAVSPTPAAVPAAKTDLTPPVLNITRSVEPAALAPSAAASMAAAAVASAAATPLLASPPPPQPAIAVAAAPRAVPKPRLRPAAPAAIPSMTAANVPVESPTVARSASPTATTAKPIPPVEARVPPLAELPEDVRRQVPAMAIGGSVYSPEPERRMIIVNGQVFVEGNTLAPELRLETINPKSAVFSIRGQRFQVPL